MEKSRAIELLEHLAWDRDIERNPYGDALNIAIEALKTQLSCEGTTSDTISRQAALEKVRTMQTYKLFMGDDMILVDKAEVQTELMMLPTAQPEPTDEQVVEYCKRRCLHVVTDDFFRTIQPEAQWIPVSERLPEDMQFVLLTVRRLENGYNHEPFISVGYIGWNHQHWWCAHDGDCEISKVEVIAWMPLPEPYRKGDK